MIKKISALVLALVLCFSIVVVPASALSDGMDVKYRVELDKDFVNPGDTVTVSLYLEVADDREWGTGAFVFGMNSAVFSTADNAAEDVKASTTMSDLALSFYKDISSYVAWQTNATIINNISTNNTAAENELYDQYIKVTFNRAGAAGSHDNSSNTKQGLPSDEINADYAANIATFTFDLVVRDDVAKGTPVNVGITTGSIAKTYTYYKYLANPGSAQTLTTPTVATSELVAGTAKIGVPSILKELKGQMRYANTEKTAFDVRALAYISGADFTATFGDIPTAKSMITEAGFVFAAGNNIEAPDMSVVEDIVKNCADKEGKDGFVKKQVSNISTSISDGNYVLSCMVPGVTEAADYNNSLIAVAYIVYEDANGESQYIYYDAAQVIEFAPLFDAKV